MRILCLMLLAFSDTLLVPGLGLLGNVYNTVQYCNSGLSAVANVVEADRSYFTMPNCMDYSSRYRLHIL